MKAAPVSHAGHSVSIIACIICIEYCTVLLRRCEADKKCKQNVVRKQGCNIHNIAACMSSPACIRSCMQKRYCSPPAGNASIRDVGQAEESGNQARDSQSSPTALHSDSQAMLYRHPSCIAMCQDALQSRADHHKHIPLLCSLKAYPQGLVEAVGGAQDVAADCQLEKRGEQRP